jgi:hypothetical protein
MGLGKDQAKMAGSSANLQNMIKQSIAPSKQREVQERQKQYRTEMTADEASKRAEANRAAKLESLGQRMGTLVNQAVAKYAGEAKIAAPVFDVDKFKNTNPNMSPADEAIVKQAAEGGAVDAKLYGILGLTKDATPEAIKTELAKYTKDQDNTIIAGVQTGLPANVMLKDAGPVLESSLGMSLADLGGLVGKTVDELQSMTVDDLQRRIDAVGQENFSEIKRLQEMVNDPTSSQAVRQEAQQRLIELGEAGVSATEADYQKMNQAVQSADIITVAGKEMTIADALKDETLSAAISAALESPAAMDKLKADMPELAKFVENNRLALKEANAKLDKSARDIVAIQADNARLATIEGVPLDDFNAAVIPGYTTGPSNVRFDPTEAHKILQGTQMSQVMKADYAGFLKDLSRIDKDAAKQFAGMNYDALVATGLLDKDKSGTSYLTSYLNHLDSSKKLNDPNVLTNPAVAQEAIRAVFDNDLQEYQDVLDEYNKMTSYGLIDASPQAKQIADILDVNPRDGKLDSPIEIASRLKGAMPAQWSKNMFNPKTGLTNLSLELTKKSEDAGLIAEYAKDGSIDQTEIDNLAKSADAEAMYKILNNGRLPFTGNTQTLKNRINDVNKLTLAQQLGPAGASYEDMSQSINEYTDYFNQLAPEQVEVEKARLDSLVDTIRSSMSKQPAYMQYTLREVLNNYEAKQAKANGIKAARLAEEDAAARLAAEEAAKRQRQRDYERAMAPAKAIQGVVAPVVKGATNVGKTVEKAWEDTKAEAKKLGKKLKLPKSDANVKFDIQAIPQSDIEEFYANIKPYYYQYLNQLDGDGVHPGFMAQDLLKSKLGSMIVSKDTDGVLQIDTWKLMGALTVTMKYLMERKDG